jgi:hypothetical protein
VEDLINNIGFYKFELKDRNTVENYSKILKNEIENKKVSEYDNETIKKI